jgi:RNA polymerase sigma factor (sigma-70 family)
MTGSGETVHQFDDLIRRTRAGDLDAFARLVQATQSMVYAVARGVLRDPAMAEDAAQEAYLRAFRRLDGLADAAAFPGWLRRIVITVALNLRRSRRQTFLRLEDVPDVPVLDEAETRWSDLQRRRLSGALLTLSAADRQLCDRRYHGGWTTARLASQAGVDEQTMRKRLQRIRDRLRKEIEVLEQREIRPGEIGQDFPDKVVELLARPQLTGLPDNPVGRILETLRGVFSGFTDVELPEIVDFDEARKTIGEDALYVDAKELHRLDGRRILRYDLTLPLLLTVRYEGKPLKLWASGKAYRLCQIDATHLDAFHQAEALCVDDRGRLDQWQITGQVLQAVNALYPGRQIKIVPTAYTMCSQAWEIEVEDDGRWFEVLAWGVFSDRIVAHLGADPRRHTAVGVGFGLERLAMLRYGIDDIRKIEASSVA